MLKITHNAGFFSCCEIRLYEIIEYFNINKKLPDIVDSSSQFEWYKNTDIRTDITNIYFEDYLTINNEITYEKPIEYISDLQFTNYKLIDYKSITKFMKKYFSVSNNILNIIKNIENKYQLNYDNLCVLFYRGNDKSKETNIPSYDEFINTANKIKSQNPNIIFLLQSDETEFLEKMKLLYPTSIILSDEIRHVKKCNSTVDLMYSHDNFKYSQYFLAIVNIMAKCKYIVCISGNCSLWICLYRGHADRVYQYLSHKVNTKSYNKNQTVFWL
jgi:hypothetical protein